jgi:hypothetical protein
MKNEPISIEARTVAGLEEQIACKEREILDALELSETNAAPQDNKQKGVLQ